MTRGSSSAYHGSGKCAYGLEFNNSLFTASPGEKSKKKTVREELVMASRTFLRRLHSFSCALRQTFSNHKTSHIEAHRLTLPLASQPSQSLLFTRSVSQKQLQEEEAKQITWLDWLMEPVLKAFHAPEKVRTEEEINERQELLSRIQACYYKKPPEEPGKEFFIEAFHTLIKYDDWRAVEALWRFSEMSDHQFDDDLLDKIEDYLLDARQRRWYED